MRDGVLVSSVRLCEIYIAEKYTQLAVSDKKARRGGVKLSAKNSRPASCQPEGKTATLNQPVTADLRGVPAAKITAYTESAVTTQR